MPVSSLESLDFFLALLELLDWGGFAYEGFNLYTIYVFGVDILGFTSL